MREAESVYQSACAVVRQDFHSSRELHPRFTVIIGADRNQVSYAESEIRLKKWNPTVFARAVVVLAFDQLLPDDAISELGDRAVRYSSATITVAGFK
jgi:hypothetical protein